MISAALRRARNFFRDDDGVISVEVILLAPLLIWVFLAMFVYWDAYRAQNTSVKATYTVADMISRENAPVNNAFVTGMHQVFRYITATPEDTWIRVSSVRYVESGDRFTVLWSRSTQTTRAPALTNTTVATLAPRLPRPADSDTLIVVESWHRFTPSFQVGLPRRTFYEIAAVRPRFLSPLPFS